MIDRATEAERKLAEADRALDSARAVIREASCWWSTEDWSAAEFREFIRTENLRQARFSKEAERG